MKSRYTQAVGDGADVRRGRGIESVDELADGHGGEDVVGGEGMAFAVGIGGVDGDDAVAFNVKLCRRASPGGLRRLFL